MNLVYTSRWYIYLNECLHWPYPHSSQHIEMKHYQSPEKASEGIAERIKNKERSKKFHLVVVPPDDDVTSIALLTCKARWGPKKQFFVETTFSHKKEDCLVRCRQSNFIAVVPISNPKPCKQPVSKP